MLGSTLRAAVKRSTTSAALLGMMSLLLAGPGPSLARAEWRPGLSASEAIANVMSAARATVTETEYGWIGASNSRLRRIFRWVSP